MAYKYNVGIEPMNIKEKRLHTKKYTNVKIR